MTTRLEIQEPMPLFRDRVGVLATMHHKEEVMGPLLEQLGLQLVIPQGLNTDAFGTFTRDVKRPGDQLYTARRKAETAMTLTGLSLAFASEGSFGPHPGMPYLSCSREIVLLVDRQNDLEIFGQVISTETNYNHRQVNNLTDALDFAKKIGFPAHGLIAMPDASPNSSATVFKGITTEPELVEIVTDLLKKFGQAHLETDMRALYNPTRMKVIAAATEDLIRKLRQCCPNCKHPGFDVVERKAGLPCALCKAPTLLTLADIQRCQQCGFSQTIPFPTGQQTADPGQCSYCNP